MNSLKDMDVSPLPLCSGWGGWDGQPSVYANSGAEAAVFGDGTNWGFSVPPRGIAVHPGADRAVAIGWESPVSGKVSVRAKVVHAHSSGGLGVTWKIVQTSQTRKSKTLALGAVDCGGSRVVPNTTDADKLAAIEVAKGDSLQLQIGPRQYDGFFGRTLVELIITEMEGDRRVWDLSKDVSADIQEGNPHADSLGNPAVWHFFTPEEESLATPRPTPGPLAGEWTIANADIKLTIGATTSGELCINELSNRTTGWNWIATPSVFPLVDTAIVGNAIRDIHWKFKGGALDQTDGQKLTLQFFSEDLSLELDSIWRLRSEHGPAQHTMRIINQSDQSVTLLEQPSIHLELAGPAAGDPLTMWTFHSDGWTPDKTGVYRDAVVAPFSRQIVTHPDGHFIPYAVFDSGEKQGVYIGIEWSFCRIAAALMEGHKPGEIRARGGEFEHFMINVVPGETFETPPALIGAYTGDVDDAGNNLRKHLFNYYMPEIVRKDNSYPKVQWNAFGATGEKPGAWNCVEAKFYPLVDDMAPLGFEEVMIDVGWWKGETAAPEPETDPVDWPSGMAKAAEYAHNKGLRFCLYWNKGEEMASAEGRNRRIAHVKRLFSEYKADMWRSDSTAGPVVSPSYESVRGFYAMLDQLYRDLPNFQYENCVCGGRVKDFGAMKRSVKIFMTDTYFEHHVRQAFYDGSYVFPPAQLMACLGSTDGKYRPVGTSGMKFAFRTMSMGAPQWFIDAPNGGNGSAPWTDEEKAAVKAAVATYKTRIRPLVRNADLYHILPRPDGKNWDGIQYYDPATKKGVAYLFKPAAGTDTMPIKLRGLDPLINYRVTFEDGTNPTVEKTGSELADGLEVTLKGAGVSELVFLEARQ